MSYKEAESLAAGLFRLSARDTATSSRTSASRLSLSGDATLTAFAAQGRTADHVIVHADSRATNLVDQKSFYVGISRAKQSVTIVTNSRAKLVSAITERARTLQTAIAPAANPGPAAGKASGAEFTQSLSSKLGAGL